MKNFEDLSGGIYNLLNNSITIVAKKALITGVYGQDGSYLTDYLLKGIRFMEFLILKKYNIHLLRKRLNLKLDIIIIDVFNFISTKLDEIFHLASLSQVALSFEKFGYNYKHLGYNYYIRSS